MQRNYSNLNKDKSSTENNSNYQIKRTDINVLLNRVRLDIISKVIKIIFI